MATPLALFREGFEPAAYEFPSDVELQDCAASPVCSSCGQATLLSHDVNERRVRERDLLSHRLWLRAASTSAGSPVSAPSIWGAGTRER